MLTPTIPGFADITQESQQTFRALLTALSEPGKIKEVQCPLSTPADLSLAFGAACLTLIDFETLVWLQPAFSEETKGWLRFHTGCQFTHHQKQADFALIKEIDAKEIGAKEPDAKEPDALNLSAFNWGSAETPEDSTTLLLQLDSLSGGEPVTLHGPGIQTQRVISPVLPQQFWQQWALNHDSYPTGVDCFLFQKRQVMGLPRSVQAGAVSDASSKQPMATQTATQTTEQGG
ncbi:MAG: phosphonate C-P lyase system protein PhnH [Cyanobacteria bacterium J06554_3]